MQQTKYTEKNYSMALIIAQDNSQLVNAVFWCKSTATTS